MSLIPSAVPAEDVEVPALRLAREVEVAHARLRSETERRREALFGAAGAARA
ncbi:MAG: hypothetical protein R3E45_09630 [Rhodocyclaceae bacterium]